MRFEAADANAIYLPSALIAGAQLAAFVLLPWRPALTRVVVRMLRSYTYTSRCAWRPPAATRAGSNSTEDANAIKRPVASTTGLTLDPWSMERDEPMRSIILDATTAM